METIALPEVTISEEILDTSLDDPTIDSAENDANLHPDLLSALSETTPETTEYGALVHEKFSRLWDGYLKMEMPIEFKEKGFKDYPVPDNFRLLEAPKLNAEISLAVSDMVRSRDKSLAGSQQQLAVGITAILRGIDTLLKSDNKYEAMRHLGNGCRMLCNSHYLVTQNRIKLIIPSLDKTFCIAVKECQRDETLFGLNLAEKIKAAKAIEKGQNVKKRGRPPKAKVKVNLTSTTRLRSFRRCSTNVHPGKLDSALSLFNKLEMLPEAVVSSSLKRSTRAAPETTHGLAGQASCSGSETPLTQVHAGTLIYFYSCWPQITNNRVVWVKNGYTIPFRTALSRSIPKNVILFAEKVEMLTAINKLKEMGAMSKG